MSVYQINQFLRSSDRPRGYQIRSHGTQILYPVVYNLYAVKLSRSHNLSEKVRPLPPAFDKHKV